MEPDSLDRILRESAAGEPAARGRLHELLYDHLHDLAARLMRAERSDHTLQPTALVHEAFLRMADQTQADTKERTHFLGLAAITMRRVLVDHARVKNAQKRGQGKRPKELDEADAIRWDDPHDVLALDEALEALARVQPRQARVVELRFFGGLTLEETADVLEVSRDTVKLDWRFARAWLNRALADG